MGTDERGLTIDELADQAGVPIRTIRFYIAEGLLPGPGARGKAALYADDHLARLRLIRRLSEQHVPLAAIRDQLNRLAADEVRSLLAEEEQRTADLRRAEQAPTPRDYVSALLRRAEAARRGEAPEAASGGQASALRVVPEVSRSSHGTRGATAPGESWHRWELLPGVELHVRADVQDRYRELIERLLREAGVRRP